MNLIRIEFRYERLKSKFSLIRDRSRCLITKKHKKICDFFVVVSRIHDNDAVVSGLRLHLEQEVNAVNSYDKKTPK